MDWRLYRLPGDREWWRIDHGPGSPVIKVQTWKVEPGCGVGEGRSQNPSEVPRAWIGFLNCDLFVDGVAANFRLAGRETGSMDAARGGNG